MYTDEELKPLLKKVVWEYQLTPQETFSLLRNKTKKVCGLSRHYLLAKLLMTYNWYDCIRIIPVDE
jgi:hypothetical protein